MNLEASYVYICRDYQIRISYIYNTQKSSLIVFSLLSFSNAIHHEDPIDSRVKSDERTNKRRAI